MGARLPPPLRPRSPGPARPVVGPPDLRYLHPAMAAWTYSSTPEVEDILQEAVAGESLAGGAVLLLFEEADLHALGRAAHDIRLRRCPPDLVTYVIDRNINYTNVCYVDCTFCAFYRHKKEEDSYVLSSEQIHHKIEELLAIGGTQILLQGGHHPNLTLDWYKGLLRGIKERYPIHIHGFSPSEIEHFGRVFKLPTREVIRELHEAGLDSIPGGGAEILNDRVRSLLAPTKVTAQRWTEIMEEAHAQGMRTSATMMFGHVETLPERVEHLLRIRESQERTGGYTAFICWTYQPANTPMARDHPEQLELIGVGGQKGSVDYLRTLAISRITLNNIDNFQASWVTQGRKIGQLTLFFGANDLGSTMMEENVVAEAGVHFRLTREQMDDLIREAGFKPAVRDNYYNVLQMA
jgi:dehypoxanthine futalosine cyclase